MLNFAEEMSSKPEVLFQVIGVLLSYFLGWVNTKWPHGIVTMASSSQFTFQLQTGSVLMDLVIWFLCWANSSIPTVDGNQKSGVQSPLEGKVVSTIMYKVLYISGG